MSLIIKGMKLPQHAAVNGEKVTAYMCVIFAHPDNSVELVYDNGHNIQRYPLTEIPTPHGRLIDADELLRQPMNAANYPKNYVHNAPTIIEAEVSE